MVKKILLISLIILVFPIVSHAEQFSDNSRLRVLVFNNNTNEQLYSFNYLNSAFFIEDDPVRVYNLFQNYVPYPQYYYDISFTIYYDPAGNNTYSPLSLITGCNIYIEGGSTSSGCTYTTNFSNNSITISASSVHSNTNQTSFTFQMNFKKGSNPTWFLYYSALRYELSIIANEDTSLSNDTYNQGVYNIINNSNANTQAIIDSQNDINNSINDDSPVSNSDLNDTLEDWNDSLSNENALSDFILMPFTILNNISSGLRSNCETYNLGSLLGHNIVLPCIDIEDYLGSNLWGTIDSLFCLFMIYNIAMLFIQCFEGITTLRDDFDSLYTPQHGDFGYRPRHGGE